MASWHWEQPGGKGTPITLTYSISNPNLTTDGSTPLGLALVRAATEEALVLWNKYVFVYNN